MEQRKIWRHYQTAHPESFSGAATRLHYLSRQLPFRSLVLNIGVGSGQFERIASDQGHRVISLDPDVLSLHLARGSNNINSVAALIQNLPFSDSCIDAVVVSEVIEHLDNDTLGNGLIEIRRILKPGGMLLGTVPFDEDLKASEVICPHCGTLFHKVGHVQSFNLAFMRSVLENQFENITVYKRAFMNSPQLRPSKKFIAYIRNFLVLGGVLTRETTLVFKASKPNPD
ncbi:class I SAM-dependent methyltransferase [Rhodanobacter sp. T12-5]|uniref:class I SAM-dependent methyltransferase n=1 Tax=Rhodanobacter sp. T12-5 TaxID=2024611 RepID=UPI0015625A20|nr:class I SAM-dependent methyltransferase [Rhodanobacter sp. T12-5]